MKGAILIIIAFFLLHSCKDNTEKKSYLFDSQGIFVANEGNFTYGNASLSFIDLDDDTVFNNIFKNATGYPLGDVAQSLTLWNGSIFVVLNNSGKAYKIDAKSVEYQGVIEKLASPRYLLPVADSKAYISDLYAPVLYVADLDRLTVVASINVPQPVEKMVLYNGFVYAVCWNKGNKVLKIDPVDNQVVAELKVVYQPNSLVADKNGFLWVLSDGGNALDTNLDEEPALTRIDLRDFTIDTIFYFDTKVLSPSHLCINSTQDTIFFLKSSWMATEGQTGVCAMSVNDTVLTTEPFICEGNKLFYSLNIAPDGTIFVSDAVDYVQPGVIMQYNRQGQLQKYYRVGIIPGDMLFIK